MYHDTVMYCARRAFQVDYIICLFCWQMPPAQEHAILLRRPGSIRLGLRPLRRRALQQWVSLGEARHDSLPCHGTVSSQLGVSPDDPWEVYLRITVLVKQRLKDVDAGQHACAKCQT